jgi:hypothetical protein
MPVNSDFTGFYAVKSPGSLKIKKTETFFIAKFELPSNNADYKPYRQATIGIICVIKQTLTIILQHG